MALAELPEIESDSGQGSRCSSRTELGRNDRVGDQIKRHQYSRYEAKWQVLHRVRPHTGMN